MAYTKEQKVFVSEDKTAEIAYYIYTPDVTPKAVFQIVHGMCERIENYEKMAEYLCERGIVVCGADHKGHGRTAKFDEELGWFGSKKGYESLESDVEALRLIMRGRYKRLPYVVFGSGMGALVLRGYMTNHGTDIDGALLWESLFANDSLKKVATSTGLKMMFNNGSKRDEAVFKSVLNVFGLDRNEVAKSEDALCDFVPTVSALNGLMKLYMNVSSVEWQGAVPQSLPVFVIGGNEGGVKSVYTSLEDAEVNSLNMKLYDGAGCILVEYAKKDEVFEDIHSWCDEVIEGVVECMKLN